MIALLFALEI